MWLMNMGHIFTIQERTKTQANLKPATTKNRKGNIYFFKLDKNMSHDQWITLYL